MRASSVVEGWVAVAVEDLGGLPYLVQEPLVWHVPTGSAEGDRDLIERAIRAHQTMRGAPRNRQ